MATLKRIHPDHLTSASVFLLALATYLATMPRTITFEDAGLFHGVCATGGIAHPPGYPLFTLACTALYQLPLDPILLGNGLSALFGAATCTVLVFILRLFNVARPVALFAGLLLACSNAFWSQAIIIEVYTLNTLLVISALYLALQLAQQPTKRTAIGLALTIALGFANHWPLVALSLPAIAVICLHRTPWLLGQLKSPRFLLAIMVTVVAGLSPYVSLFLKTEPLVSYAGPVHNLSEGLRYFLREVYASQDHQAGADLTDKLSFLGWVMAESTRQFSILAMIAAVIGVLVAFPVSMRSINLALLILFLCHTAGLALLLGFNYEYPSIAIFRPYPLVAWCCLAIWAGLGLNSLHLQARRYRGGAATLAGLATLALVTTFASNLGQNNRVDDWLAAETSELILTSLEDNAAMVVRGDTVTLALLYQHTVRGLRPDVELFHISNIVFPAQLPGQFMADRAKAALAMISERPVYSAWVRALPLEQDYGFYIKHDDSGQHQPARDPRHDEFRRKVIQAYLNQEIRQPHDRVFAMQLLIALARQLTGIAQLGELNEREAEDLALLQTQFPGVLITLYTALTDPSYPVSGDVLLNMAYRTEANMPPEVVRTNRADFYYYYAELFLQDKRGIEPDPELAKLLLMKGFDANPVPGNPGACRLLQLGAPEGHAVTRPPFASACAPGPST